MKTDANWLLRLGTGVLALSFAFAVASCGKGGGTPTLGASTANQPASTTATGNAHPIGSGDIASLPADEQKLLTDPGWNQPYIQPDPATLGLPAPSTDDLLALTRERMLKGDDVQPRGTAPAPANGGKSASWIALGSAAYGNVNPPYAAPVPDFDHNSTILQGEYFQFQFNATPTYGCNADSSNEGFGNTHHAIEDTLAAYNATGLNGSSPINYVLEGLSTPNWFNTGGANGNNPRCAIYQVWCTTKAGDPSTPAPPDATFAETSFRSDLTKYGAGPGQGIAGAPNTCSASVITHGVRGYFWKAFNRQNAAQPNGTPVRNFNILIAPADEGNGINSVDPSFKSSQGSQVEYQTFYFGSVGACYGGGQIVGLSGTTSSCQTFKDIFTPGSATYSPGFFYNPVYGIVLKRWQQMAPPGAGAWKGPLGAPVFGPVAYNNGNATTQPGKKWYAWGWYFEKGFMWYVDNDQALFPNAPDEAQVYSYSGSNTYCTGGTYTQQLPSTFFLGASPTVFKVNVGVTGYSADGTTFSAPFFNTALGRYQIGMSPVTGSLNPSTEQITISANASGYGGAPNAACQYNKVIWAWRDGTITGPLTADNIGLTQTHQYLGSQQGQTGQNKQNIYVLRVQLSDFAAGSGNIAYGDSLPMELGQASSLPDQDVLCVNAATGSFASNANYTAMVADLDAIKVALPNFAYKISTYGGSTVADAKKSRIVIWFHGGPAVAAGAMDNTKWQNSEPADLNTIMTAPNPKPVLVMGQNVGIGSSQNTYYNSNYNGYITMQDPIATPAMPSGGAFNTPDSFLGVFGLKSCNNFGYTGMPSSGGDALEEFGSDYSYSSQTEVYYGYQAATLGETYSGTNSSGKIPSYCLSSNFPHCQMTIFSDNGTGSAPPGASGTLRGAITGSYWDFGDSLSVGNSSVGTRNWIVTYPWAPVADQLIGSSGITRANVLRNMLASLDNTIGAGTSGGNSFGGYSGVTQIVAVTPIQFLNLGGVANGNPVVSGAGYPDVPDPAVFPTGYPGLDSNVYRHTVLASPPVNNYIVNSAARTPVGDDTLNGNDMQFDFPFYAYVVDPLGTLTVNGSGTLNSGTMTWTYGGLLLVNNGTWTRVNPANAAYKTWNTLMTTGTPAIPAANQKSAAGYYWGTAGTFGGTVRASYGLQIPSLTFDNRDGAVSFECIAHWPGTLSYFTSPATVRWSLYPAHGVLDLNNPGHYYGERSSFFTKWITDTDIDKSITPPATYPGSQGPVPKRNTYQFNVPDFNYQGNLGGGRVADFNFGTIKGWDGDIDRDNVRGEDGIAPGTTADDKFPARCRIFTNFAQYLGYTPTDPSVPSKWSNLGYGLTGFPDNVPDPNSFVEGGCYVVDKGPAITKVSITDDPAKPDPKDSVASPSAGVYDVGLGFSIFYGDPGYSVEFCPDFNTTTNTGTFSLVPGLPNNTTDPMDAVNGYPVNGAHFPTVRVNQAVSGDYNFAVRVTDLKPLLTGDLSAVYVWPGKVPLKPPFKSAVMTDPQSNSVGGRDVTKMKSDLETIYGSGSSTVITAAQLQAGLADGSMNSYDIIAWPDDSGASTLNDYWAPFLPPSVSSMTKEPWFAGPSNTNLTAVRTAHQTAKAAVVLVSTGAMNAATSYRGAGWGDPWDGVDQLTDIQPWRNTRLSGYYITYAYSGQYPDPYDGIGYNIFGSMATTPNTIGTISAFEANNVGQRGSPMASYTGSSLLKNFQDPANYPSSNCENFSSSWFTAFGQSYICGGFARRNVATDQALVSLGCNWGDLLTTQGTKTRAHLLENMLCAGKASSRYNSPTFN